MVPFNARRRRVRFPLLLTLKYLINGGDNVRKIGLCSCEIKGFYVTIVLFRPVRRNSTFRRHGLTSVCFFVFAYSVGVWLKLQKYGDEGNRTPVRNGMQQTSTSVGVFYLVLARKASIT